MTMTRATSSVPTNWKSQIDQVVRGYETEPAKGLIHGLQKDFIQNSWGHRKTKKGQGWGIEFKLTENARGTFLLVQDWGTYGMTGPNMSMSEINHLSEELSPDYRLARFSAMNYSGGNEGAGLFGRGKTLFSAASMNYHYYFETLTKDEGYRMNWKKIEGNDLRVGEKALEEEEGKDRIKEWTGLDPIEKIGSRIIIESPLPELIEAIKKKQFLEYIEETWWKIILKYKAKITIAYDNKNLIAKVPQTYKTALRSSSYQKWEKGLTAVSPTYKIKKIGLYLSPVEISRDLRGVYVYRKDMKIGEIPIEEFPKKIRNRYFGFVEVDNQWEEELSEIEDLEHYGFTNKRKRSFQTLKNAVNTEHMKFMEDMGIIKKERAEDKELYEELVSISDELDQFFDQFPIEDITRGSTKKVENLEVKWSGVEFPDNNHPGNHVITGDEIKNIKFEIKNNKGSLKNVQYKLKVVNQDTEVLLIDQKKDYVEGDAKKKYGPYSLAIQDPLVRYEKNTLTLEVNVKGAKTVYKKEIPFFYDILPAPRAKNSIYLERISMVFPDKQSKRVNTNENISNIQYVIKNESANIAFLAFSLTTHDGSDSGKRIIETIFRDQNIVLYPYEEKKILCPDIIFSKEPYESAIFKGPVEIRARLAASSDFAEFEMADVISKNPPVTVFFNEEGNTISETFSEVQMIKGSERRSDIIGSKGNWIFYLYLDHPIYQKVSLDEETRREYIAEEMIKQMIRLHLHEGNYSILDILNSPENPPAKNLTDAELVNKVYLLTDQLQTQRYIESRDSIG